MTEQWKAAALGALGGATISLVVVFGAARLGAFQNPEATRQTVHDYLLAQPEMLQEMSEALTDKQQKAEVASAQTAVDKQGLQAYLKPNIAFVTGPANAKTTIVEFFDYNCPYCRASIPAVEAYYDKHKNDTRFAFVEFPIKGDESVLATRAMIAARRQPGKYVPFHFALMRQEGMVDGAMIDTIAQKQGIDLAKLHTDMNDPEIAHQIAAVHLLAKRSKINGTPTFIINGKVRPGAVDKELLAELTKPRRS